MAKKIEYRIQKRCDWCDGRGAPAWNKKERCTNCGGTGWVSDDDYRIEVVEWDDDDDESEVKNA